ncbi:helix-turn-helix domain-containing protein [Ruegeria arenilitoris]|uniref:helix-turn-helix domain-containing protein n=1 Tax=Ruegeria arenilitoris TaxID=1173585 RepID=UPI001FD22BCC|nr:helix-turn-helix transcriptional regulator [Ruegeria arenilitoris]
MAVDTRTPAELRNMLGANLRQLADRYPSVAELCRQLGVNRTQFNRYLSGESFPRPDVLDRICRFFDVDARILLKPLEEIPAPRRCDLPESVVQFLRPGLAALTEDTFPSGVYLVTQHGGEADPRAHHWLVQTRHLHQCAVLRGFLPPAMAGTRSATGRELRGFAACAGPNIYAVLSREAGRDSKTMVIRKDMTDGNGVWIGSCMEHSAATPHIYRLEIRHLGHDFRATLEAARLARRT